jgi:glucokinase
MAELLASGRPTALRAMSHGDPAQLNPVLLETAALQGDLSAQEIYRPALHYLGLSIANQITVLNPARLVLGGGVLTRCPQMRAAVAEAVGLHASWTSRRALSIADAALGDDSGLIGAALLASPTI